MSSCASFAGRFSAVVPKNARTNDFPPSSDDHFPWRRTNPRGAKLVPLEALRGVTPVLVFTRYSPGNIGPTNSRGSTRVRGKPEKGEQPLAPLTALRFRLQSVSQLGGVFRREFGGLEVVHYILRRERERERGGGGRKRESLQPVLRKPAVDPKSTVSPELEFVAR